MKRKYRYRKYYAVVYYDRTAARYYVDEYLTKKEARARVRYLFDHDKSEYSCIDIVKRVWSWRRHGGLVDLEAL